MAEVNLCAELQCAACCRNMYFPVIDANFQGMIEFFPKAKKVPYTALQDCSFPGVYYTEVASPKIPFDYLFRLVGKCPYNNDGWCGKYENRPDLCRKFMFNGGECVKLRHAR